MRINKTTLFLVCITGYYLAGSAPARAAFHTPGYMAISPQSRSERFKNGFFLSEDPYALIWGFPWVGYLNKNLLNFRMEGVTTLLQYYNRNNNIESRYGHEVSFAVSYGRSLIKDGLVVPYLGLSWSWYDQPGIIVEQDKRVIGKNEITDYLGCDAGLKSFVNKRVDLEYNFNSARRLRHRLLMDLKVGGDIHGSTADADFSRIFLFLGGGLDERKAYQLFVGFKLDFVKLDKVGEEVK